MMESVLKDLDDGDGIESKDNSVRGTEIRNIYNKKF